MNGYFTPVDEDGFAQFAQGATPAGWYQLATPGATLPTLPGIPVPPEPQGILVQAHVDLDYCQSPAQTGTITVPMRLPAGATIFIPGATAVKNFCVKLGAGGASFAIQFWSGNIGPTLHID